MCGNYRLFAFIYYCFNVEISKKKKSKSMLRCNNKVTILNLLHLGS